MSMHEDLIALVKDKLPQLQVEAIAQLIEDIKAKELTVVGQAAALEGCKAKIEQLEKALSELTDKYTKANGEANRANAELEAIRKRECDLRNGEIAHAVAKAELVRADAEIKRNGEILGLVFRNAEVRQSMLTPTVVRHENPQTLYNNGQTTAIGQQVSEQVVEAKSEVVQTVI